MQAARRSYILTDERYPAAVGEYVGGASPKDIAARYGWSYHRFRGVMSEQGYARQRANGVAEAVPARVPEREREGEPEREREIIQFPSPENTDTDDQRAALRKFLGTSLEMKVVPKRDPHSRRKIIVLSDAHGDPEPSVIEEVVNEQPDIVNWNGDLFNATAVSAHDDETDRFEELAAEESRVRASMEVIAQEVEGVEQHIGYGNHDAWIFRAFRENPHWRALKRYFNDPLETLITGIPNAKLVNTEWQWHFPSGHQQELAKTPYMHLYGNTLISHANFTDKWASGAVRKLWLWIARWQHTLGLPPLTLYIQGHGHKCALTEEDGGNVVLVEPGMVGKPRIEEYKAIYRTAWSPGSLGCVVFEQDAIGGKWVNDLGSVRLIRPRRSVMEKGA